MAGRQRLGQFVAYLPDQAGVRLEEFLFHFGAFPALAQQGVFKLRTRNRHGL